MKHQSQGLTRREFLAAVGAGAAAAAAGRPAHGAAPADRPPNVIFIFADDLGYADLGCFGSKTISTPNIDRMAAEGMKLTDFHTASPVCTPTRSALMTGCYPKRLGLHVHVLFPQSKTGLNPDEITVAEVLKAQGYATACIGKWHMGHHAIFLPTRQGFDSYYGIPYSNDMGIVAEGMTFAKDARFNFGKTLEAARTDPYERDKPPLMRGEEVIEWPADQATLTERYTDEALKFIRANKDRPFFLYLPHTFPHVPLFASERFKGKSRGGLLGDTVECIDWSCGEILKAVKELGLDERTLVIFTSDNGPAGHPAPPLRGGKGTTWEGGQRVPFIARWPGRIPAGAQCGGLSSVMDVLPTLARLAGGKAPADRIIDGKDIWPLISGQPGAKTPHEAFYHYSAYGVMSGVRCGKWKCHTRTPLMRPAKGAPADQPFAPALYDLEADIGEQNDLAAQHPDVVKRLAEMAENFDKNLTATSRPVGRIG
ncbi:MAG: sulfatase [Planctomycetes bacterium]|nr:sulfatase [Planctomycetota bacterium]